MEPTILEKRSGPNPAQENLKEFEASTELARIIQKNERLSFRIRLKGLKRFVRFALLLLLIWSATTESLFLFAGFYEMSSSPLLTILGMLLLVILIEGGKFFFGCYFLQFITQGWVKDGLLYFITFLALLPITLGLFWGSYYLSVNGAPQIAHFVKSNTSEVNLVNTDSISQHYDSKILHLKEEIKEATSIKWRGTTTNTATQLALGFQNQVNELEKQKKTALQEASFLNRKRLQANHNSTTDWGKWLARFGGYGEVLTFVFLLFLELYDRAAYLELPTKKSSLQNPTPSPEETPPLSEETLVQQAVSAATADQELEELRAIILSKEVDTRYLKQRAKQCFKRSFKPQSSFEVRNRNLKKAGIFIQELANVGIETKVNPKDETELLFE